MTFTLLQTLQVIFSPCDSSYKAAAKMPNESNRMVFEESAPCFANFGDKTLVLGFSSLPQSSLSPYFLVTEHSCLNIPAFARRLCPFCMQFNKYTGTRLAVLTYFCSLPLALYYIFYFKPCAFFDLAIKSELECESFSLHSIYLINVFLMI